VHNRANRLGTLTFRVPCFDHAELWGYLEQFRRNLNELEYGDAVCIVPEAHPGPRDAEGNQVGDSHGWHVHLAVARFVPVEVLQDCWARATSTAGFVDIRKIRPPRVKGARSSSRHSSRTTARYVAKTLGGYVTKAHDPGRGLEGADACGEHRAPPVRPLNGKRFSVAKGQVIPEVRFTVVFPAAVASELEQVCGYRLHRVWDSPEDWDKGPPLSIWQG
jgi:hypothetical protein